MLSLHLALCNTSIFGLHLVAIPNLNLDSWIEVEVNTAINICIIYSMYLGCDNN